jgi:hypothetical protein
MRRKSATSHLREYIYLQIIRLFFRSIFCYFFTENLGFFRFYSFFSFFHFFSFIFVFFETVCFGCFASIPKQRVSMFRLNRNKQKNHPNSLKESIFGYFLENLGLFRLVSVSYETFCLFRLFRYRFEATKQTKTFGFWFHETNRNKNETGLVSVCFGSTEIYFCLFRGHPTCDAR